MLHQPTTAFQPAPTPADIAPSIEHPDAELLRLVLDVEAITLRMQELTNQSEEVERARFREPPVPEVLFWRMSDLTEARMIASPFDSRMIDGRTRNLYIAQGTLAALRKELADHEAGSGMPAFASPAKGERLREIIAAGEAWHAERAAAYQAAGLEALDQVYDREAERKEALARQIALMPALTPDGVGAKVRAYTAMAQWNPAALKDGGFAERVAEATYDDLDEVLQLSAVMDAARFVSPAPAPDAGLLALRPRWLEIQAAMDAIHDPRSPADMPTYQAIKDAMPRICDATSMADRDSIIDRRSDLIRQLPKGLRDSKAEQEAREERLHVLCQQEEREIVDILIATPARTLDDLAFKAEVYLVNEGWDNDLPMSIAIDAANLGRASIATRPPRSGTAQHAHH